MRPPGRKAIRFHSKRDCHPGKGNANWWEDCISPSKGREKTERNKDIRNQLKDFYTEGENEGSNRKVFC